MTSNRRMDGKVAIVTGAASAEGMGWAISRAFAREGASVILTGRDDRIDARAAELQAAGASATAVRHDVTSESDWRAVFDAVGEVVDVLVNNAGIAVLQPIELMKVEDFERQIQVNLTGAFIGCRHAVAAMRSRGGGGSIINIASLAANVGILNGAAYCASKGGMRQLSKAVALECAADKIRCNTILPGLIRTGMHDVAWRDNPDGMAAVQEAIPMRIMGDPEDIAACALYLASDESRYVTGTEIIVDGGLSAA